MTRTSTARDPTKQFNEYWDLHANNAKEFRDHLATINAVVHSPTATAALRADDQKLRTFSLGPAGGHPGVAPFTLLIADGKVLSSLPDKSSSSASTTTLPNAAQYLKAADFRTLFPPASKAHLIRTGFVNCHSGACDLILAPIPPSR